MVDRLSDRLEEYLATARGRNVILKDIRAYLNIEPGSKDDQNLRTQMSTTMVKNKIVTPSGRNDGVYKVVTQVKPVRVFVKERERRPPFQLFFPKDFDTGIEMSFAESIVIREGDIVTIGGVSNYGKTCIALNFCGENINYLPVLMGNDARGLFALPGLESMQDKIELNILEQRLVGQDIRITAKVKQH